MKCELIVSTFQSPQALRLSLLSILGQARKPDFIAVADDGSGPETANLIKAFASDHKGLRIRHVWQEDQGFQKAVVLNKAIATSEADYLIFTDGDCLMSEDFIARHMELAKPGRYCCGSLIRLPAAASSSVTEADVRQKRVFSQEWLRESDAFDRTTTWLKSAPLPKRLLSGMEIVWPVRRTFSGCNASAFRDAIMGVNGFDETMVWGGGDKEFGIRLRNSGVKGRHLRFTAPVVHLDHPRGYRDREAIRRHRAMIREARASCKTWTDSGIMRH